MTGSYSQTATRSFTYANVRYVNDKIAADLEYLITIYPKLFTKEQLQGWKNDFYNWINDGYATSIKLQLFRGDTCFYEIQWEIRDDGSITGNDNVGRLRVINPDGLVSRVVITNTNNWHSLSIEEKSKFYKKLDLSWGLVANPTYAPGLIKRQDKQYSSGSLGIQRSILGGK